MPKLKLNFRIVRTLAKFNKAIAPAAPLAISLIVLETTSGIAATFASSDATVTINNFSHNSFESEVITDTFTNTFVTDGNVNASTDAVANFITPPSAFNSSFSSVDGNGNNYSGTADSFAGVLGSFNINSGETFSFNFNADFNLTTSIDNPQTETAIADGTVSFALYDTSNLDGWTLLDSLTITGNVTSEGNDFLNFNSSNGTQLNPSYISWNTNFGGDRESASASTEGIFSRTFDRFTNLTLVEVKENRSTVAVPEPSIAVGTVVGVFALGYRAWNRRVAVK